MNRKWIILAQNHLLSALGINFFCVIVCLCFCFIILDGSKLDALSWCIFKTVWKLLLSHCLAAATLRCFHFFHSYLTYKPGELHSPQAAYLAVHVSTNTRLGVTDKCFNPINPSGTPASCLLLNLFLTYCWILWSVSISAALVLMSKISCQSQVTSKSGCISFSLMGEVDAWSALKSFLCFTLVMVILTFDHMQSEGLIT